MVKNVRIVWDYIGRGTVEEKRREGKEWERNVSVWLVTLKLEGMTKWSRYLPTDNNIYIEKKTSDRVPPLEQRFLQSIHSRFPFVIEWIKCGHTVTNESAVDVIRRWTASRSDSVFGPISRCYFCGITFRGFIIIDEVHSCFGWYRK